MINPKCATMENPQANSILEPIHKVIENLVCKFDLHNNYLCEDYPWSGILVATDCDVQSMHHTIFHTVTIKVAFAS